MKNNTTKLARVLRRLLGEDLGATMMEYVILAVMIAAAVTAAAIYFGNSAKNQFDVAGQAMTGSSKAAETSSGTARTVQEDEAGKAHDSLKQFNDRDDQQKLR